MERAGVRMGDKIYKYFSASVLELVFAQSGHCGIKCSLPKDYNDPYELFLGVDLTVTPELLATYRELVADLPQYPTSCFSESPAVTPMWAHYGDNHSGFVIEFDVDALKNAYPNILISDVEYRTEPNASIARSLQMAEGTKKPRHGYFLQQTVLASAYFSKDVAWSYERECRLLDQEGYCETIAGNKILKMPMACCTALIVGKNASSETVARTKDIAADNGMRWFQTMIGKSTATPFFQDEVGGRAVFDNEHIVPAAQVCESCAEPIPMDKSLCPWCSITEDLASRAAQGNPFRILENYGLLEGYYKGLEGIARARQGQ